MPPSSRAQSSAVRAIGPTQSIVRDRGRSPRRLTSRSVGLRPAMPHQAAGSRIEPAVSVPTAPGSSPAATAAAEPEEEPCASRDGSQGFRTGGQGRPKEVPPTAYSGVAVLASTMAPARRRAETTPPSATATASRRCGAPAVVGTPATSMRSLMPTGMPCSGPIHPPDAMSSRARCASPRAASARRWTIELIHGSIRSIRSRQVSTRRRGSRAPDRMRPDSSARVGSIARSRPVPSAAPGCGPGSVRSAGRSIVTIPSTGTPASAGWWDCRAPPQARPPPRCGPRP